MGENIDRQNVRYYDAEAAVYDEKRYGTPGGRRVDAFQKQILDRFLGDLERGGRVLELGCGTGRLLPHVAGRGYEVTGLDISPGMLEVARSRLAAAGLERVALVLDDAGGMPFPDGHFDAVYSILVINLIPDYPKTFAEVRRVLRADGVFAFSVPNLGSVYFPGGLYVNARGKTVTANETGHRYSHWFSHRELRASLGRAGFTIEELLGQPPQVRWIDDCRPLGGGFWGRAFSKSLYVKARCGASRAAAS